MRVKSIIVFVVLDDNRIHQVLLNENEKAVIKHTLSILSTDALKVSEIDFSEVMQLPEDE